MVHRFENYSTGDKFFCVSREHAYHQSSKPEKSKIYTFYREHNRDWGLAYNFKEVPNYVFHHSCFIYLPEGVITPAIRALYGK